MIFRRRKIGSVESVWGYLKRSTDDSELEFFGNIALVVEDIKPLNRGRIKYGATYWFGRCEEGKTLVAGTQVKVIRREGNTWLVSSLFG